MNKEEKTLRDEIAIEAMKSLIIGMAVRDYDLDAEHGEKPFNMFWTEAMNEFGNCDRSALTENAYEIADAMLETRKRV